MSTSWKGCASFMANDPESACDSESISDGAAKMNFHRRLVVDKHLALEKPGVAYVFIKGYMHPDRIAGLNLSFEFCPFDPGKDRGFGGSLTAVSGFFKHLGHEQGPGLKNSFTKQDTRHYGVTGIMALEKIKIRRNEFFRNYCLCIKRYD